MKQRFTLQIKQMIVLCGLSALGMALNLAIAQQQSQTVSGVVRSTTDATPLEGVGVAVKGSETQAATDANGKYVIRVTGDNPVLVFKSVGYESQEISVNNRSVIDVSLAPVDELLNEVVVTALGIEREKKSLGYSVGTVAGEDLVRVPQTNVVNSLAGRVPGVTINQTGGPGSTVSMIIRGQTSLSTDNQPLFVVDGIPMQNTLNNGAGGQRGDRNDVDYGNVISDINPENIESISILKGPSAAALYGSRAGNGVVLITTKSGRSDQGLGITFSSSNVFEMPYRYVDFHYKYANGDRPDHYNEGSAYWGGLPLDQGYTAPHFMSPLDENGNKIPIELKSYPDNAKNFLETGVTSVNNLSVSGSRGFGSYRVSYDMMRHNGMIPNSDLKRDAISSVAEFNVGQTIKLRTNLNFLRSSSPNRPATGRGANPLFALYNWSAVDVRDMKQIWLPGQEHIAQRRPGTGQDNPYFLAYELTNAFTRDHAYGNVEAEWKPLENLTLLGRVAHDMFNENQETKIPWSYSRASKGGYYLDDFANQETNMEFRASYRLFSGDFDINLTAGTSGMRQHGKSQYLGGTELTIPGLYRIGNIPTSNRQTTNHTYEKRIYSVFGLASIGFDDKVYLDLTARNDWSSTLPVDDRSYFYPSASLSWLVNNTFTLPSAFSLFKLRGGVAQVGNDTGPYQLYNALGTGNWGDLITINIDQNLRNPILKPEIATSYEGGLDLSMFGNRLRFEGTYFYVENKNQILDVNVSPSSGYVTAKTNAGLLSSRGLELMLSGTPIANRNGWNLDVSLNWSRTRARLDRLAGDLKYHQFWSDNGGGAFTWVGEDIGNLYSRGYMQVTDPNSPYYRWPILGQSDGQWIENNGVENMEKVGNWNPDFLMGGQIALRYKRFSLVTSFDWRKGGQFMSWTYRYGGSDWKDANQERKLIPGSLYAPEELAAMLKSDPEKYIIPQNGNFPRVGGHTAETGGYPFEGLNDGGFIPGVIDNGDGTYTEVLGGPGTPILSSITDMFSWGFNKQVTFDADFLKIREISLGYSIPNFSKFRNMHISVYTQNIMLWTKSNIGVDPERAYRVDGSGFRQGIEWNNILPYTSPIGFKVSISL